MKLDKNEVAKLAFLARLKLTDEEAEKLSGHLNQLLQTFEKLQELDTENVEPTSHVIPMQNVFREDVSRPSWDRDELLANAPDATDCCFVVPRIVET